MEVHNDIIKVTTSSASSSLLSMRLIFGSVLACAFFIVFAIEYEAFLLALKRDEEVPAGFTESPSGGYVIHQRTWSKTEAIASSSSSGRRLVVDVLSTGSTTRWNYITSQQQKWGSHPTIRYFEGVNEDHHQLYNTSCEGIQKQVKKCLELGNVKKDGRKYYFAPEIKPNKLFMKKSEGWMCAQHRPVIGLHSVYGERYRRGDDNPDWLLIVDDDTTVRMNVMEMSIAHLDPDIAYALVGKYIFYGWPLGGFGVALSRAAIRRLFQPIYCNADDKNSKQRMQQQQQQQQDESDKNQDFAMFSRQVCKKTLPNNLIFELDEFVNGMSILDLMLAIQLHRKPFCWHSDWYMGWFLTNHIMLGQRLPRFPTCPAPYDCQPNGSICENSTMVCHDKNKTKRFQHLMSSDEPSV